MTIAACPKCHDEVQLPSSADRTAQVRCPLCSAEFELATLLDQLPPSLIVLNPVAEPDDAPYRLQDEDEVSMEPAGADSGSAAEFEFDEVEAPQEPSGPQYHVPAFSTRPSGGRRRRQKNPLAQAVGVIVGGLAAIPLAQLVLWWGLSRDPIQAGPWVAKRIPMIVPQRFRGLGVAPLNEQQSSTGNRKQADNNDRFRNGERNQPRNLLGPNDQAPFSNDRDSQPDGGLPKSPLDKPETSQPGTDTLPKVDLSGIKESSAEDIDHAVQQIIVKHLQWRDAANPQLRQKAAAEYFKTLCKMGEAILFADHDSQRVRQSADAMDFTLRQHLQQPQVQEMIGQACSFWLKDRTVGAGKGFAAVGTIQKIDPVGLFSRSTITLRNKPDQKLEVIGWIKPPPAYQAGRDVLILGAAIDKPQSYLGDEIQQPEALCGGYVIVLPQTKNSPAKSQQLP